MLEHFASISGIVAALVSVVAAGIGYVMGHSVARKRQELEYKLEDLERQLRQAQRKAVELEITALDQGRLSQALEAISAARADIERAPATPSGNRAPHAGASGV